jgi:hypothetical protein
MSPLYQEALRRIEAEGGPPVARQAHPGYYSRRIVAARSVADAARKVAALEGPGPPLGIVPRLVGTIGRRLAGAALDPGGPRDLWTVEGWVELLRAQRAYIQAIDADDEEAEREREEARHRNDWAERERQERLRRTVDSPYLTAEEAVLYLRLGSRKALYGLVARGLVKPMPGSRRYRFTAAELDAYLRRRQR